MNKTAVVNFLLIVFLMLCTSSTQAQKKYSFQFNGQLSAFGDYNFDNTLNFLVGGRYIPELNYNLKIDTNKSFYAEASVNIFGNVAFHPFDSAAVDGNINPYRIWARFSGNQYEIRVGLQQIDFGSATLLRPLQWFDAIDPRDPLKLTTGVYAALGRYYFHNNANLWMWVLYGNDDPRGFDVVPANKNIPEIGGRAQTPVPKGEVAISYHHRTADSQNIQGIPAHEEIPEDRIGLDGKWDVGVGLWFEASFTHKTKDVDLFTNQSLLTMGIDYTFGIGNGLNVTAEHLIMGYDEQQISFNNNSNISAISMSYPIGMFENISCFTTYNWSEKDATFSLNLEHQFKKLSGYIIVYYNPDSQQGIQNNEFVQTFAGPGVRLMLVYNH